MNAAMSAIEVLSPCSFHQIDSLVLTFYFKLMDPKMDPSVDALSVLTLNEAIDRNLLPPSSTLSDAQIVAIINELYYLEVLTCFYIICFKPLQFFDRGR